MMPAPKKSGKKTVDRILSKDSKIEPLVKLRKLLIDDLVLNKREAETEPKRKPKP